MASEQLLKKFDALFKNKYSLNMQRGELVDTVDRLVRFFDTLDKAHDEYGERQNKNETGTIHEQQP